MDPIVAQTQLAMTFVPTIFKTLQYIVYFTILKMHTKGYKQGISPSPLVLVDDLRGL